MKYFYIYLVLFLSSICQASENNFNDRNWWKGNLHSHSLWSDGDAPPEEIVSWYLENNYNFLVLSEHDIMSTNDKWVSVMDIKRCIKIKNPLSCEFLMTPEKLNNLEEKFGKSFVKIRKNIDNQIEMKLKTLYELRQEFESQENFILINGEEITDRYLDKALHVNAINIKKNIIPKHGKNPLDTIQNNVDAILNQGKDIDKPVLAIINHPNMEFSITPELLSDVDGIELLEIYNGYGDSFNKGDEYHPSVEVIWDITNTIRIGLLKKNLLFGVATDDAHNYYRNDIKRANPGRGWVVVDSQKLSYDDITKELKLGNFYSSTGVELEDIIIDNNSFTISIDSMPGVNYKTIFIGSTKKKLHHFAKGKSDVHFQYNIGSILKVTQKNPAIYEFSGDELFVRAKVISSKFQDNPSEIGNKESAWVQPVKPKKN